jgi:predicted nucleotidyltransferase component of viral defense system
VNKGFFKESESSQLDTLDAAQEVLGIDRINIEKDIWMCWVLEKLFQMAENQFVFKGGTTLSKVYELIDRYSEDIDITVNYGKFSPEIDFTQISNTQLAKLSDKLKENLENYLRDEVAPYLNAQYAVEFNNQYGEFTLHDGENIYFNYPSVLAKTDYKRGFIKIEFGARNTIEPSEIHSIDTYIDKVSDAKSNIKVNVLSPERTFWEKATLIHVECHRGRLSNTPDRLSRHWYDLYKLANSDFITAIKAKYVLNEVLTIKRAFYRNNYSNYDRCAKGGLQLIPENADVIGLKTDYQKMINEDYFFRDPPGFNEIITGLKELENKINMEYFQGS